jgi:hypothetical protein
MKPFKKIIVAQKSMKTAPPSLQKQKKPLKKNKMKMKKKPRRKRKMFSKTKMVLIYLRFLAHPLKFSTPRTIWSNQEVCRGPWIRDCHQEIQS